MTIDILYFARLRETLGTATERFELSARVSQVKELLEVLRERGGVWARELADSKVVLVAVNQEIASLDTPLRSGDEVAIFPPVTGG
ncbi:molybdopterin converting factor subunit 1 [Chitinimonas lacunae]|uniref:Molybdopterin synthase sulfur carrier subunit n=1 Tax=Chitinimonas lacunae TaxID=1963018 RepID=A0ABV8MMY7_9NEIS